MPPSSPYPASDDSGRSETDNFDKLIRALNAGFTQLGEKNKEQSDRVIHAIDSGFTQLGKHTEKLQMAIHAQPLQPPAPESTEKEEKEEAANEQKNINKQPVTTDAKTEFWTSYKKLADEQDKEFVDKYSADLENSLIFAGLFSAVTSAFIIQIQPEIEPGTSGTVLIAQCLLYTSLGMTLLASLLTVLGKQWIMHYSAAGEKGTLEARGLERQQKFDGLHKWKFDVVMQTFPLLLQVALLLFGTALSIYLWKIHHALAIIVLSLTAFGFTLYVALLASAVVSPDSPYQTPLTPVITYIVKLGLWTISPFLFLGVYLGISYDTYRSFLSLFSSPDEGGLFGTPYTPSPEVPAVSWVLKASTDPYIFNTAVEMVPELQWPVTQDSNLQYILYYKFLACFNVRSEKVLGKGKTSRLQSVRNGMSHLAVSLGRAYCILREDPSLRADFYFNQSEMVPELQNVVHVIACRPNLGFNSEGAITTKWALHVIPLISYGNPQKQQEALQYFLKQFNDTLPNLDPPSFTDYLFCVNNFLSTMHRSDMLHFDKSWIQHKLLRHLFAELATKVEDSQLTMDITTAIIETTGRLASKSKNKLWSNNLTFYPRRLSIIYEFCSRLPQRAGWIDVVLTTGLLTGEYVDPDTYIPYYFGRHGDADWVYKALESIIGPTQDSNKWDSKTLNGVGGLLNALLYYNAPAQEKHLDLMLPALSMRGDISKITVKLLFRNYTEASVSSILSPPLSPENWFKLDPILNQPSMWSSVTQVVLDLCEGSLTKAYIHKGHELASIPHWQPYISRDPASWILISFQSSFWYILAEKYTSVLSNIENTDTGGYKFIDNGEKALGTTYAALNQVWMIFDFKGSESLVNSVPWLYCISSVLLQTQYGWPVKVKIRTDFTIAFAGDLHDSLMHAARRARESITENDIMKRKEGLEDIASILEGIASKMPITAADLEQNREYWKGLRDEVDNKIKALKELLQSMSSAQETLV